MTSRLAPEPPQTDPDPAPGRGPPHTGPEPGQAKPGPERRTPQETQASPGPRGGGQQGPEGGPQEGPGKGPPGRTVHPAHRANADKTSCSRHRPFVPGSAQDTALSCLFTHRQVHSERSTCRLHHYHQLPLGLIQLMHNLKATRAQRGQKRNAALLSWAQIGLSTSDNHLALPDV